MKKRYLLSAAIILFFVLARSSVNAQGGVAVNVSGLPPDGSALFDLTSANKGLLVPRMTTVQRDSISNPAAGLTIFNTDCHVYNYNAGTAASPIWATMSASNVLTAGVSITASPAGAICAGTNVTFSATPSQNNLSPNYQWQINGNSVGSNSATYTTNSLSSGDVVTCVLTSSAACVTGSPATSNSITMLVNTVPSITGTTAAGFCTGSAVTLSASADIGTINWYSVSTGGSSLSSGASFTVSGLNATTTYYVDATANNCTSVSRTAVVATFYPTGPAQPGVITGPAMVRRIDTATYSVSAQGNTATYGWAVTAGTIIAGQGTNTVTVAWGDTAVGGISVLATNSCGSSAAQKEAIYIGTVQLFVTDSLLNGVIQSFIIPPGVTSINIDAYGAQGGSGNGGYGSTSYGCNCSLPGGLGAEIMGTVNVSTGDVIKVLVGQAGGSYGGYSGNENGGGGGTFVVDQTTNTLFIAAGGGGGGPSTSFGTSCSRTQSDGYSQAGNSGASPYCPQCGCGTGTGGSAGSGGTASGSYEGGAGGGYTGNGANGGTHCTLSYGGLSYTNGGTGGLGNTCYDPTGTNNAGGFGGGGGGQLSGPGGGGGYSGGGTLGTWSSYSTWGGGGGSYNAGTNQTNNANVQAGHGKVIISW